MSDPLRDREVLHGLEAEYGARREDIRRLFDTVADDYDRTRPRYPDALFADLRAHVPPDARTVLEVGCGSGQATGPLAAMAGEVWCVELGAELADRARRNLAHLDNVRVVVGTFEDTALPTEGFDLVVSATAFHWIDPAVAYPRAAALLRPEGALALCTNAHIDGGTQSEIADTIQSIHEEISPEAGPWQFPTAQEVGRRATQGGDIAHVWSRVDRRFDDPPDVQKLFAPPFVGTYRWTATYDAESYSAMLGTQSPYLVLDTDRRNRLLDSISRLVDDRLGGTVTKDYLAILAVARRT